MKDIVLANDARLFKKSRDVTREEFGESLNDTILELTNTMYQFKGIGISAVQVGDHRRIMVVCPLFTEETDEYQVGQVLAFINPKIIGADKELDTDREGCLSFPNFSANVDRFKAITLQYRTPNGESTIRTFRGYTARIIQHELEHLDGVTLFNHSSNFKRQKYLKELNK